MPQPGAIGGGSDTLETRYGQVIDGVFNPLTQFDGQLLHSKGIGLFNGVDFVGEVVPPEANVVAQRRTNPLFGLGLVDAVPDQTLMDLAQFQQEFTPETAGQALVLTDIFSGQPRVGRFGWKCQIGTVLTFSGNAFLNEMGITTPFFPHENPPAGATPRLLAANPALTNPNDITATRDAAHRPHDVPGAPPQLPRTRSRARGGPICSVGCANCHLPAMRTGPNAVAALNEVDFFPFSDFLLHDMGSLNDGIAQSGATGHEMRTAPLWRAGCEPASSTTAAPGRSGPRSSPTTARGWRPATASPTCRSVSGDQLRRIHQQPVGRSDACSPCCGGSIR